MLCEKPKALYTGWKLLKQTFNVLNFWLCALFSYKNTWAATESFNDCNK